MVRHNPFYRGRTCSVLLSPADFKLTHYQQGTEMDWLRRLVCYWVHDFDWGAWERRLNALNQFTWQGIQFVYQRATSGRGVPLILTHGWPGSFLDSKFPSLGSISTYTNPASIETQMLCLQKPLRRGSTILWVGEGEGDDGGVDLA